jgi:hypothetical protein
MDVCMYVCMYVYMYEYTWISLECVSLSSIVAVFLVTIHTVLSDHCDVNPKAGPNPPHRDGHSPRKNPPT